MIASIEEIRVSLNAIGTKEDSEGDVVKVRNGIGVLGLVVAGQLLLLGCGKPAESGGAESADEVAAQEPEASSEPGAPGVPWKDKTFEQRQDWMGIKVLPAMKALWAEFEPEKEFKCQTCHGEDMEAVKFKMPNSLYALPADDPMKAAMEYDEDTAKFMAEKVLPKMAELLDMEVMNEQGEGFGCLGCHLTE